MRRREHHVVQVAHETEHHPKGQGNDATPTPNQRYRGCTERGHTHTHARKMRAQLTLAFLPLYYVLVNASKYGQGIEIDSRKDWFQPGQEIQSVSWDSLLRGATKKSQSNDTLLVGKMNVSVSWSRALKRLANKRRPVVIKNSPIKSWKALQLWSNTSYIANTVPNVNKVRKSSHPTFVYEDTTRMLGKYVDPNTKTKFFENYVSTTKYKKSPCLCEDTLKNQVWHMWRIRSRIVATVTWTRNIKHQII